MLVTKWCVVGENAVVDIQICIPPCADSESEKYLLQIFCAYKKRLIEMNVNDIRQRVERIDQNMLAAYKNGGVVKTSRGDFNITDEARMASWLDMRNAYAQMLSVPETVARDYRAATNRGADYTALPTIAIERINGSAGFAGMDNYMSLTHHTMNVPLKWEGRRQNGYRRS